MARRRAPPFAAPSRILLKRLKGLIGHSIVRPKRK